MSKDQYELNRYCELFVMSNGETEQNCYYKFNRSFILEKISEEMNFL